MTSHPAIQSQVRAAFPAHRIEAHAAFAEWGATYFDGEQYSEHLQGRTWEELDRAYLTQRWDALGFLGTPQLVAVLPAYLLEMLAKPYSNMPGMLASVLTKPSKEHKGLGARRFDALVEQLTEAQRVAIAAVLRQFTQEHPDEAAAAAALASHWDAGPASAGAD